MTNSLNTVFFFSGELFQFPSHPGPKAKDMYTEINLRKCQETFLVIFDAAVNTACHAHIECIYNLRGLKV